MQLPRLGTRFGDFFDQSFRTRKGYTEFFMHWPVRRECEREMYGLEITDVDWLHGQIHIRRSVYDGEVQTPKTMNAYRVVDVAPWVLQIIRQHIGERKMGLVFLNKRRHAMRHTTVLRRHFHPLLRWLGIPRCGFHAFRHGRVSHLVERGVSRDLIKQ